MNVVIYARFSSHSQTEQSIEGQLKICYEFANRNNYTVVGEYIDRALSGTNDNRPQLQQMLVDSNKKLFQGVLVYAIDRFGRNLTQSTANEFKLQKNGVVLLSATENFEDNPGGKMYRNMLMTFAQYYSDELRAKITRGMDINGEKCLCTGGGVALGLKVDSNKRFQIDEETAPIVREIFNMYANGKTVAEIINLLNERHISTSRGNEFNKNSLHRMLRNKRYIGTYTYKGKETPGAIPRIIDDETFNTVQKILDTNKKAPARARAKTEYLLTTKLFCGHCKDMMTGVSGKSHTTAKHHYYICNNRKKKLCDKKTVRKDFIEELVIAECRKLLTDKNIRRIAKEISAISEREGESFLLQQMRKQYADNEKKKRNLITAVTECEIEIVRKPLYEQLAAIEQTLSDLDFQIAKEMAGQVRLTAPEIRFFLNALKKGDPDTAKYKKTLIAIFVNAIYLYDDKITLVFNSGDKPVTITNSLLSDIEKQAEAVPVGERFVYDHNASTIEILSEPKRFGFGAFCSTIEILSEPKRFGFGAFCSTKRVLDEHLHL